MGSMSRAGKNPSLHWRRMSLACLPKFRFTRIVLEPVRFDSQFQPKVHHSPDTVIHSPAATVRWVGHHICAVLLSPTGSRPT